MEEMGNLLWTWRILGIFRWHKCNFFSGQILGLEAALLCQLNTVTEIIRLEMRVFFKRSKGECDLFLRFAWDNVDKGWLVMPENEVRTTFKAKTQASCSRSSCLFGNSRLEFLVTTPHNSCDVTKYEKAKEVCVHAFSTPKRINFRVKAAECFFFVVV